MQGWIFDAYADHEKDSLVLWLWSRGQAHRIEDAAYRPSFFVHASLEELREFRERLALLDGVRETRLVRRRISLERREKVPVLEVFPRHYRDLQDLARIADSNGRYHDFQLFNVDLRLSQRYFLQHRIFPMGLVEHRDGEWRAAEEQFALDYELPPLKPAVLDLHVDNPKGIPRFQDRLLGARVGEAETGGSESEILEGINTAIREQDPDLLLTDGGDAFVMPYLARKSELLRVPLHLGRDPDPVRPREGKSYFTYGKIVYKPSQYLFRGRIHLDRGHFAYREADLAGLAELSRLSCLVPQEQSRLTPGTAITAMQVNQATRDGVLVLWKKNRPEEFKTAEDLLLGDRGGFTFEPAVGLHENILEVDFASLYPNIMAKYNISPETLDCACCKEDGLRVPELAYHTCVREKGLIGRVLAPVVERKRYYKRMKKERGPKQYLYTERDAILKWLLVTCMDGSTVVPYRRDGVYRVDSIRDIIDPVLPRGGSCEPPVDMRIFSTDSDYRVVGKRVARLMKSPAPQTMLSIRFSRGRKALVTSNHRFYIMSDTGLRAVPAAELRPGHFVPIGRVLPMEGSAVQVMNLARRLLEAGLPPKVMQDWRVRGEVLKKAIASNYKTVLARGRALGYTYRTIWLWRRRGMIPLLFLDTLGLTESQMDTLDLGRARRGGGAITFLPARVEVDEDLAFFLGFYVADGSGSWRMVRFGVAMDEQEIVGRLLDCAFHKFRIVGGVTKDRKANMLVVQMNSVALVEVLIHVFGIGPSNAKGKLVIPPAVLNGPTQVRFAFFGGLLAGDGYMSPARDWAFLATADREFAFAAGALLATLGIDFNVRAHRPHGRPLYCVDVKLTDLEGYMWLKDKHRRRLRKPTSRSKRGHREIPLRACGLFDLAMRGRSTHQLSRNPRAYITREKLGKRLPLLESGGRREDEQRLNHLRRLAEGDLTFVEVVNIEKVPSTDPWVYCFEVEGEPNAFICNGDLIVGNSFGYTGYKNARFGRIECHEAINAYAREIMLRSMDLAESHGYEVLHGIVDSLWLRPTARSDPPGRVVEHISTALGLPLDMEGTYKWVVFLPAKTTGVGALNRYYGVFQDGELKLRGIELRKHDTCPLVNRVQAAILEEMSKAGNATEFHERLPRALDILRGAARALREGLVPIHDLVLTKSVTREIEEYSVFTNVVAALKQMEARGYAVHPGESIRFAITRQSSRDPEAKVRVAEFLRGDERPDVQEYLKLLARSGETLFAPFGHTEESLLRDLSTTAVAASVPALGESLARVGVGYRAHA